MKSCVCAISCKTFRFQSIFLNAKYVGTLKGEWEIGEINGILFSKLFWPSVRKNCSSDRKKLLKFEAEEREFSKNVWDQ